ncbi:germination protein YpeB [Caminicella sporogenes]|uniref:germination protein YpeB n=1 Tax=Caminicella sporogenes TaxID=166485 RepID=UPI002541E682|nr:germination protein YpeB [Caminicella sporogenes]WIF96009.1 germination protein YpeB [Caminicella sporogenes]
MRKGIIIILVLALIATGIWGYWQYKEKNDYYTFLDNQFQRMFYDFIGSVETISTDISKLLVSSQDKENIVLYSNILMNAYNAQEKLSQLPIKHEDVTKIEKFLSQVGDYTFALSRKNLNGDQLNYKDKANLEKLQSYSVELAEDLHDIHKKVLKGTVWKNELRKKGSKKLNRKAKKENPIQTKFVKFQERMVEYPELIYDGPFSEHAIQGMKPRLVGKKISIEEAQKRVTQFLGNTVVKEVKKRENARGKIDTYSFTVKPQNKSQNKQNPIYIDISQKGGKVVWMLNNRKVERANISQKQAINRASNFLDEKGYKNMVPTFSLKYDNVVTINYVYSQDGVLMYPDLIKVKIALDDGSIVGFDATKFLIANYKRNIPKAKLNPKQARQKVSMQVKVNDKPRLCYIPTPSFREIYCYEFKTEYKGDTFFIYINAQTGEEEKILKLIKSENGTLMI